MIVGLSKIAAKYRIPALNILNPHKPSLSSKRIPSTKVNLIFLIFKLIFQEQEL